MTRTTTQELNTARDHYRHQVIPAEKLSVMDQDTRVLQASGLVDKALKAGDIAPDFTLADAAGHDVHLQSLLLEGPVVLTFYRGGWCPYCNIELRGLDRAFDRIRAAGATVVAVSPQAPEHTQETQTKNQLRYPVVSDIGNRVGHQYGVVFRLSPQLLALYQQFGHGLDIFNGPDGSQELPIPATFIITTNGTIHHAFVDADYTKRLDPDEILQLLDTLPR